jgi:hypothetical protein
MSATTKTFELVKMCGTESAQVVAAYLPGLLQQTAPWASLRTTAETPNVSSQSESAVLGVIVLLPAEPLLRRSAWYRFIAQAAGDVPVLPIVVGDLDASEARGLSVSDGEQGTELSRPRPSKRAADVLGKTFRGQSVLPTIRVANYDARIEHGGHFHLEREAARDLGERIKSLVDLGRSAFFSNTSGSVTQVGGACHYAAWGTSR